MNKCDNCGNIYDKSFQISIAGQQHTFDSFECAINTLAPSCSHCGTRIIGHGMESGGTIFCCAHCAKEKGHIDLRDRV